MLPTLVSPTPPSAPPSLAGRLSSLKAECEPQEEAIGFTFLGKKGGTLKPALDLTASGGPACCCPAA